MPQAAALLETHRRPGPLERKLLVECIEACVSCAQSCTACADADLAEDDVTKMRRCIRLCLDCADVCEATGRVLTRQTEFDAPTAKAQLQSWKRCAAPVPRSAITTLSTTSIAESVSRNAGPASWPASASSRR